MMDKKNNLKRVLMVCALAVLLVAAFLVMAAQYQNGLRQGNQLRIPHETERAQQLERIETLQHPALTGQAVLPAPAATK